MPAASHLQRRLYRRQILRQLLERYQYQPVPASLYFPPKRGSWETVEAVSVGWNQQALDAAMKLAGKRNSTGVVMLQGGRILAEQYWKGATAQSSRDIESAQKSVTAILIGIAQSAGLLSIDDSVTKWLGKGWSKATRVQEAKILVHHLLTQSSGLDDNLGFQAPPATMWYYNTPAYHVLHSVLETVTGSSLQDYSQKVLFGPTGMTSAVWSSQHTDGLGLDITPRDMAKFGLLILAEGRWNNKWVLNDPSYLNAALSASQTFNPSYGMLWWLNGASTHELPGDNPQPIPGPIIPTAPNDLVAALGANDQKIYVVPSLDLVVVRQGGAAESSKAAVTAFDDEWWKVLMAAAPQRSRNRH